MLSHREVASFAAVCADIGNEVADEGGFVAIRDLLDKFQATLLIRPLLVEGMLAAIGSATEHANQSQRWAVLVDSETYKITDADIAQESSKQPLPARFRNTVAHELVHSLAFRPSDFGVTLQLGNAHTEKQVDLVRSIEQATESLSPLLLLPTLALSQLLRGRQTQVTVDELDSFRRSLGVSRQLLVSRLAQLSSTDGNNFRDLPALRNVGIGIAEWIHDGSAIFRSWPLYINFENNIAPALFRKLSRQDRLSAHVLFPKENFAARGGPEYFTDFLSDAGLSDNSTSDKLQVQCAMSRSARKSGSAFLYVVHGPSSLYQSNSLEQIRKKFGRD